MIEIIENNERHGEMTWTGEFDADGRAIYVCPLCGRCIALGPYAEPKHRCIKQGGVYAAHSAHITLDVIRAALEGEIWPQMKGSRALIERWRQAGGAPVFKITGIQVDL